jgi:hypothetical protein
MPAARFLDEQQARDPHPTTKAGAR